MSISKGRSLVVADIGGQVLDYAQLTSTVNITATTEGTAQTLVTGNPVTYDGATEVMIEWFSPDVVPPGGGAGRFTFILLYEDATLLGRIALHGVPANGAADAPSTGRLRRTPSAGSHTYTIKSYVSTGTGQVNGGTGGSGAYLPAFLRIVRSSTVIGAAGIAGVQGGFAPLDSGLLVPREYLGGAWTDYTPTLTASTSNPTLGDGTLSGRYKYLDSKTLALSIYYSFGSLSNAGSGEYRFALPPGVTNLARYQVLSAYLLDNGTRYYPGTAIISSGATIVNRIAVPDASGVFSVSHNVPFTWATGDHLAITGIMEVA